MKHKIILVAALAASITCNVFFSMFTYAVLTGKIETACSDIAKD